MNEDVRRSAGKPTIAQRGASCLRLLLAVELQAQADALAALRAAVPVAVA
jgi:hypothetical protein